MFNHEVGLAKGNCPYVQFRTLLRHKMAVSAGLESAMQLIKKPTPDVVGLGSSEAVFRFVVPALKDRAVARTRARARTRTRTRRGHRPGPDLEIR